MHYYSFNIGDYTSHTAHLSPIEDIAYRRLLDLYYQTESPLQKDFSMLCRQIRMRGHEDDVRIVLQEFFIEMETGWVSARCEREIAGFKSKADTARMNGRRGGRPKNQSKTQEEPTNNQPGFSGLSNGNQEITKTKANQEPLTKNQEPLNTHTEAHASDVARDDLPEPHELPKQAAGNSHPLAGVVCKAIKMTGIGMVNPGHPKLNALLHSGVSVEQVTAACQKALNAGKNFAYALGILVKEEQEARDLAKQLSAPKVAKQRTVQPKSFAQQERERGWLRWEEMTGREHEEMRKIRQAEGLAYQGNVIDVEPTQQLLEGGF